ncbi:MAG: hypothetical protein M3Y17_07875 [Actinomycetota bacterium]|nr:hypothetical protein [Actinomycetota bacterium]
MSRGCSYHCGTCGSHFTSLAAFDLHRAGDYGAGTRHCLDPDDVIALRAVDGGMCAPSVAWNEPPRRGVIVYEYAADADRMRTWRRKAAMPA